MSVLYVDHTGHPAPLSLCYHATASRVLSSSIDDRSPPSTSTEVDSAYCPQCLSFYDAATAAGDELRGRCPRGTCRRCPLCEAALSVSIVAPSSSVSGGDGDGDGVGGGGSGEGGAGGKVCMYRCGFCQWTSEECGVSVLVDEGEEESVSEEEATRATEALARKLADRTKERASEAGAEVSFQKLVDGWRERAHDEGRRRRQPEIGKRGGSAADDGPEGWSVESLEKSLEDRRKREVDRAGIAQVVAGPKISRLGPDDLVASESPPDPSHTANPRPTPAQSSAQLTVLPVLAESATSDLLPLPIPLRARKGRRCRAELAAGRTGILVKPKVNPLEGDSSLRSGHGQWWKKDSSAVHSVPRVSVVRHVTDPTGRRHALLLCVHNPTLGTVRLRLGPSDSGAGGEAGKLDGGELEEVLIDGIDRTRATARWIEGREAVAGEAAAKKAMTTEAIELEPVQDAFLEMGRGQSAAPEEAEAWDAGAALGAEVAWPVCLREVAVREDKAWVEMIVVEDDGGPSREEAVGGGGVGHFAAAISLMIEIGEGSWESSLVKPLPSTKEGEVDSVDLDLVVLWQG